MPDQQPNKIERALKLDFVNEKENIWLTRQNSLRKLIGILGVLLPILLFITIWIDSGYHTPLYSISHYYFTRACPIFVIIVSLLAIFLIIYKGKQRADFILSSLAGIFALLLVIFPTSDISTICQDPDYPYSLTIYRVSNFRPSLHYISAAIFLSCLAGIALFIFTKSDKAPSLRGKPKRRRNRVFRTCGFIMIAALLVIVGNFAGIINESAFSQYHLMFWMESVAIWAFGFSWLVKGEMILKD